MDLLTNIAAFIFALGVIIFVHEAGHLLVGKAFKMRVLAFSLGFGKKIFGFRRGETDYRVSLVPLGGYVSLAARILGKTPPTRGTFTTSHVGSASWSSWPGRR